MHFELRVATPGGFEPDVTMAALGSARDDIYSAPTRARRLAAPRWS